MNETQDPPCVQKLRKLWDTYEQVVTNPNRVIKIREGEKEVEYGGFNIKYLERMYMIHHNQCGHLTDLPAIGPGTHIQRGPATGFKIS